MWDTEIMNFQVNGKYYVEVTQTQKDTNAYSFSSTISSTKSPDVDIHHHRNQESIKGLWGWGRPQEP